MVRDAALEPFGIAMDGDNVHLPNVAPDEGLSASFNSWFTLFGQFFDHGLDLVNKGGSGTVFIPLQPDDPLYVEGSHTNFMVLTRATVSAGTDGIMGTADDVGPVNTTTSFVDQNQTYTSHSSHQVFLRQYVLNADGDPVATGKLIEGANGGMATWGEVKAQAPRHARHRADRLRCRQRAAAAHGRVRQLHSRRRTACRSSSPASARDGIPNTGGRYRRCRATSQRPSIPTTVGALRTGHAFLADIAHEAVPIGKIADGDITIGLANPGNGDAEYDNELLDAHFIAGDGRVNENIGLTAVHHVFHAEHNRLVEHTKDYGPGDRRPRLHQRMACDRHRAHCRRRHQVPRWCGTASACSRPPSSAPRCSTSISCSRSSRARSSPHINPFLVPDGFDTTINPSIVAEFAHVVYRFGHSMLTESIDRFDPSTSRPTTSA